MNLDDYSEVKRTKVLVYGPPKSGKTAIVGQLAEHFTLHWCDLESGIKTLMQPEILKPEFRKNVHLYNFPDHRAYPIAIDGMRQLFKGGSKKFCYSHGVNNCPLCTKDTGAKWSEPIDLGKFTDKDILVIDSLTQLSSSSANKVTLKDWQKDDEYKMTFDDYRMQNMYIDEVLSKMQASNINVCVISHQIDIEKDDKKEKIVPVASTRNFSSTVAKYFDSVIYMQVINKRHSAYADSTWSNTVLTGSRNKALAKPDGSLDLVSLFKGA